MAAAGKQAPAYKRSWKNLLLNKRYQLRFTLFMVGVSAILMSGLGIWVMKEANEATTVSKIRVQGEACPKIPDVVDVPTGEVEAPAVPMNIDPAGSADAGSAAAPQVEGEKHDERKPGAELTPAEPPKSDPTHVVEPPADPVVSVKALWCVDAECTPEKAMPLTVTSKGCDDYVKEKMNSLDCVDALKKALIPVVKCEGGETFSVADAAPAPRRATVQLEESSMTITPTLPTDFADRIVSHHICEMRQASAIDALDAGRARILYVLIGTGLLLMVGLGIYGIKMTHKVAGPLFKVTLYLAKMRDGRYDKVWNLRKGDQLMDFYEHFKSAHAGVVTMEKEDIEKLKATIAAAKDAGLGDHETVKELETVLARKEKALE